MSTLRLERLAQGHNNMYSSRIDPYPLHGRYFCHETLHPSGNPNYVSYISLKVLVLQNSHPSEKFQFLMWNMYRYFLELHNTMSQPGFETDFLIQSRAQVTMRRLGLHSVYQVQNKFATKELTHVMFLVWSYL